MVDVCGERNCKGWVLLIQPRSLTLISSVCAGVGSQGILNLRQEIVLGVGLLWLSPLLLRFKMRRLFLLMHLVDEEPRNHWLEVLVLNDVDLLVDRLLVLQKFLLILVTSLTILHLHRLEKLLLRDQVLEVVKSRESKLAELLLLAHELHLLQELHLLLLLEKIELLGCSDC